MACSGVLRVFQNHMCWDSFLHRFGWSSAQLSNASRLLYSLIIIVGLWAQSLATCMSWSTTDEQSSSWSRTNEKMEVPNCLPIFTSWWSTQPSSRNVSFLRIFNQKSHFSGPERLFKSERLSNLQCCWTVTLPKEGNTRVWVGYIIREPDMVGEG